MPTINGKKYNDIIWEASVALVSWQVKKDLATLGAQGLYMHQDKWNEWNARAYRKIVRSFNHQLKAHGTSLRKINVSKRPREGGGFTIVFEDKKPRTSPQPTIV